MTEHEFASVRFKPWLPGGYGDRGVLVLGESHYAPSEDYPEVTIDVVREHLERKCRLPFLTKIAALVSETPLEGTSQSDCFENFAFYNYVQRIIPAVRTKPSSEDFQVSENAFREILDELQPSRILALGWRLYDGTPNSWSDRERSWIKIGEHREAGKKMVIGNFLSGGREYRTAFMSHPSCFGFSPESWRPAVQHFLNHRPS